MSCILYRLFVFCCQFFEQGQGFFDGFGFYAVRSAEVAGAAEVGTGNEQQVVFLGAFTEGVVVLFQALGEEIECPLRLDAFKTGVDKALIQELAVFDVGARGTGR